jgi:predicted histone-like DNA-binding protein
LKQIFYNKNFTTMIDYSVYKQSNPLDETAAPKAYAKAQMRESMSFSDFVNHIASHNGVFSRGTVKGVLSDACLCIVEQLLNGNKVQLGELGNFWISLTSTGADSQENFSASNIKAVNIVFTPGPDFENLRSKANFNLVASRVAQAATLKAEKTGSTIVDLEAAREAARPNGSSSGSNGSNGSNGSSQSSGAGGANGSSGSSSSSGSSTDGGTTTTSNPRLTINRSGSGTATVTAGGNAVSSGAELAEGTEVSVSITPAEGATPTATLGSQSLTLTESDGTYSGSFTMPSSNVTLTINTGGSGGGNNHED